MKTKDEAVRSLREWLKPGDTAWTVLRHVSRSGMSRTIDVYALGGDSPAWLSRMVATATGYKFNDRYEAVTVGGTGMDMGFALVYDLSRELYGDGYSCLGLDCPSSHHQGATYDQYTDSEGSAIWHTDGYALRHRWL